MISFRLGCSTHHLEDVALQEVAKWISTTGKVLVVKEISDKDGHHIHSLSKFSETVSTFRQQFLKKYDKEYKGKKGIYSVKGDKLEQQSEIDSALRYLCKGKDENTLPVIFENTLITEEEVIGYHKAYWKINAELRKSDSPQKQAVKQNRGNSLTFVQEVAREILKVPDKKWDYDHHTKTVVFNQVMTMLGVKGKVLDAIIVRRLCYGVLNIIAPCAMKQHMWSQVFPDSYEYDT